MDTDKNYIMTKEQAEKKMELYREVFPVVRILESDYLEKMHSGEDRDQNPELKICRCYEFWNKEVPCENCSSIEALQMKKQKTKMEVLDSELYMIISRYVEIDGKPCVMECVRKMDDAHMIDQQGRESLVEKLTGFREILYEDVLTQVSNRRYYEDELRSQKQTAGVAMIDLDDFKLYNDIYGHSVGDIVLRMTASVIRRSIRCTDTVIRYGGDEFLIVLPDITKEAFLPKLQLIKENISELAIPGYSRIQPTASIGGVMTSPDETIEKAARRADSLMYRAKNQKNRIVTEDICIQEDEEDQTRREEGKQMILIVDDSEFNRAILSEMLHRDYNILEAASGKECLQKMQQYGTGISLVLLDIVMPDMDGFEVLDYMNREHWIEDLPVVMISSEDSPDVVKRAYGFGVTDYISRPFDAHVVYQRVTNTIKLYAKQKRLSSMVMDQMQEKEKNSMMLVNILSHIVEFRNGESGQHVIHINKLTEVMTEQLLARTNRYPQVRKYQQLIVTASALHDIGKIGIDEAILNKPGKLTAEEFEEMKQHTRIGAAMLRSLGMYQNEKLVTVAYEICRWHHERYDGRGYPDGLVGDEIPIAAQIVSLVDVYDALVSERVYKKAFSHEKAMQMIADGECGAFNPILLDCLQSADQLFRAIYLEDEETHLQDTQ